MAEIKKTDTEATGNAPQRTDKSTGTEQGVPEGAATEESHGGYGGTDRLQSEAAPLHPEAGKDQAKDI